MLKWFSKRTPIKETGEKAPVVSPGNTQGSPVFRRNDEGFYLPLKADVLLASPQRKNWLQQISRVVALPDRQYRELCLAPLNRLAERLQCVPAAKNGKYAGEGGLLDLTLTTTAWAMKMSQKDMLPRGIPSEEQTRQFSAWNVSVFYTGLFHWLSLTTQLEGQLNNQSPWQPGISTPVTPFRFRFREPAPDIVSVRQTTGALMAFQLLPEKAVQWLANYPRALQALTDVLTGQADSSNDLLSVLNGALGAFPAETLAELSLPASVLKVTAEPQDQAEQSKSSSVKPMEALTQSPLVTEVAATPLSPDELVSSGDNAEAEQVETDDLKINSTEVALPADVPLTSSDTAFLVPDELAPPSDDLRTALELTGILTPVPVKEKVTKENVVPNEEMPLLSTEQQIAVLVHVPDIQSENYQCTEVEGERFWRWFKEGVLSGKIENNTPDAKVHSVMGYLFCQSPAIFYQYAQEEQKNTSEINEIISAFELLKFHRVVRRTTRQTGHFRARLYADELNPQASDEELIKLPHKKISGYMIKGSLVFGMNMPEESLFIRIVGR